MFCVIVCEKIGVVKMLLMMISVLIVWVSFVMFVMFMIFSVGFEMDLKNIVLVLGWIVVCYCFRLVLLI